MYTSFKYNPDGQKDYNLLKIQCQLHCNNCKRLSQIKLTKADKSISTIEN